MNYSPKNYESRYLSYKEIIEASEEVDQHMQTDFNTPDEVEDFIKPISKTAGNLVKATNSLVSMLYEDINEDLSEKIELYTENVNNGDYDDEFPFAEWANCISDKDWMNHIHDMFNANNFNIENEEAKSLYVLNVYNYLKLIKSKNEVQLRDVYKEVANKMLKKDPELYELFDYNICFANESPFYSLDKLKDNKEKNKKENWTIFAGFKLLEEIEKNSGDEKLKELYNFVSQQNIEEKDLLKIKNIVTNLLMKYDFNRSSGFFTTERSRGSVSFINRPYSLKEIHVEKIGDYLSNDLIRKMNLQEPMLKVLDSYSYSFKEKVQDIKNYVEALNLKKELENKLEDRETRVIKNKI